MKKNNNLLGLNFENKVANLYRLMGYTIEQNLCINGHQIDIIAKIKIPGSIEIITAIECKFVGIGNLTKNSVMENINALSDLKRNSKIHEAVVVTTNGFAKNLWDTAKSNEIHLLKYSDIEYKIIDFSEYVATIKNNFINDELCNYYVEPYGSMDYLKSGNSVNLENFIYEWIKKKKRNHLSILGEYGIGKTSLIRKVGCELAKLYYSESNKNRIPIIINLKDYSKSIHIRQLITDVLINEYGLIGMNYHLFKKLNEKGMFLIIFDGFDEMSHKVIFDEAYANFQMISELANNENAKVILTCRTEFFKTHSEETEILQDIENKKNHELIYINEFNDDQIKKFLQRRIHLVDKKNDWAYYYKKINEIFDLKDLAKRPVLLELIVRNLPELIKEKTSINATTLYLKTIENELKRRLSIGKTIIIKEDRLKLIKILALWMYTHDQQSIYYEAVPNLLNLEKIFDLKTKKDIEYHLNDFLTCSFLNRDAKGNFRFSHKSFIEFFVAWGLTEEINSASIYNLSHKMISFEIRQFLKFFDCNIHNLEITLKNCKNKNKDEVEFLATNAFTIIKDIDQNVLKNIKDFSNLHLEHADIEDIDLATFDFSDCCLKDASFKNSTFRGTCFTGADLTGVKLADADFSKVILGYAKIKSADFTNSTISDQEFDGTDLSHTVFNKVTFTNVVFKNVKFDLAKFNNVQFEKVKFVTSNCQGLELFQCSLKNVSFIESDFSSAIFKNNSYKNLKEEKSNFWGTYIKKSDLEKSNCNITFSGANFD